MGSPVSCWPELEQQLTRAATTRPKTAHQAFPRKRSSDEPAESCSQPGLGSVSTDNPPVQLALAGAPSATGKRGCRPTCSDMPDFLTLGLSSQSVVATGLQPGAICVGGSHVVELVGASELQGAEMLRDPRIPDAVDQPATEHTDSACLFPNLEAPSRGTSASAMSCRRRLFRRTALVRTLPGS
jgi:hypothetical protein